MLTCTQAAFAGSIDPQVLVTVPTLKPYADAILNGIDESKSLLRPGQDAHTFTLAPSQRQALDEADIILIPDRKMNALLDRLLDTEARRGAKIIVLTSFPQAKALPYPASNPWLEKAGIKLSDAEKKEDAAEDEAVPDTYDPHIWIDPIRMANLALPVADAIADAAPSHRAQLEANAHRLSDHLRLQVSPAIAAILASAPRHHSMSALPQVPFITYHAAYQYFLRRYGLEAGGDITQRPEDYLGARSLHNAMESADKLSIRCIISETDTPLVRRLATAAEAQVVPLSPEVTYTSDDVPPADWVHDDYDRFLQKTAMSFAQCL